MRQSMFCDYSIRAFFSSSHAQKRGHRQNLFPQSHFRILRCQYARSNPEFQRTAGVTRFPAPRNARTGSPCGAARSLSMPRHHASLPPVHVLLCFRTVCDSISLPCSSDSNRCTYRVRSEHSAHQALLRRYPSPYRYLPDPLQTSGSRCSRCHTEE